MIYFYGAAFVIILISLIAMMLGISKPTKIDACLFRVSMLLVVFGEMIKSANL